MADDELRESERGWRAAPDDQTAVLRLIAALRRAGRVVPEALLDTRVQPARTFRSRGRVRVSAALPGGEVDEHVGHTGEAGGVLKVPEHRSFVVHAAAKDDPVALRRLAEDCDAQQVERVHVGFGSMREDVERVVPALVTPATTHLWLEQFAPSGRPDTPALHAALERAPLVELDAGTLATLEDLTALPRVVPAVERLALGLPQETTDDDVARLGVLRTLRELRLQGGFVIEDPAAFVGERALAALGTLPALESLEVRGCELPHDLLSRTARFPVLRRLVVTAAVCDLAPLGDHDLRELSLSGQPLDDAGLGHVGRARRLEGLSLDRGRFSAAALRGLPTSLRSLSLPPTPSLEWLEPLGELRRLRLEILDEKLDRLALASGLEELELHCFPGSVQPIDVVAKLPRLRRLCLWGMTPTSGLEPVRGHPSLEELALNHSRLWDEDLEALPALPRLRSVHLYRCDSLTSACLDTLRRCTGLRRLTLDSNVFGLTELELLRRDLPDVLVEDTCG